VTPGEARIAAAVRIATGLIFIAGGAGKLPGHFLHGGFAASARDMARESWPFWRDFLEWAVIPHAGIFGRVVALGELALGVSLLVGLAVRAAAACGAVLMAAILLGQANVPGATWDRWITAGLTTKFALLLLVLLFAADAGQRWGLDGRRRKSGALRRPRA
jgi:thiosulfate dehydrogenase (quinone) large subunit